MCLYFREFIEKSLSEFQDALKKVSISLGKTSFGTL